MGTTDEQGKDVDNEEKEDDKLKIPGSPAGTSSKVLKQKDADCRSEVRKEKPMKKQDSECKTDQKRDRSLKRQNSEAKIETKRDRSSRRRDSEIAVGDKDDEQSGNDVKPLKKDSKSREKLDSDAEGDSAMKSSEDDVPVDVVNSPETPASDASESKSDGKGDTALEDVSGYLIGDKVTVKYGRGKNQRVYEAKVGSTAQRVSRAWFLKA